MAHLHEIRDTDSHFIIDPITREITNPNSLKNKIMQNDHNSEVLTFEIAKMVEGHDMSLCNNVRVHYINLNAATRMQSSGIYEVTDFAVSEDNPEVVVGSWTISRNATQITGVLHFVIEFSCFKEDGTVDYSLFTSIFKNLNVGESIYNAYAIIEQYADIIATWENRIANLQDGNDGITPHIGDNGNWFIGNTDTGKPSRGEPGEPGEPGAPGAKGDPGEDGVTPKKGVDYFTEAEKTEIVNDVLTALPTWEGGSY